jgi:sugar phosphate isomerase/epimerase
MNAIRIASPLFIVREDCNIDLFGTLRKLAKIGYEGVEFIGFYGHKPSEIRKVLDDCGLCAMGDHVQLDTFHEDIEGCLDTHETLGCRYITISGIAPDAMPGTPGFAGTVDKIARIAEAARCRSVTLLYHNHAFELLRKVDGVDLLEALTDGIPAEDLKLELDLGWIAIGGGDPVHYLTKYKDRSPVLHFKDFYTDNVGLIGEPKDFLPARGGVERGCFEFRPTGYGIMNYPAILDKCLACNPEWIVADHDLAYERDSYDDLKLSLAYVRMLLAL